VIHRANVKSTIAEPFSPGFSAFRFGGVYRAGISKRGMVFRRFWGEYGQGKPPQLTVFDHHLTPFRRAFEHQVAVD
jgi:hypothetical protein